MRVSARRGIFIRLHYDEYRTREISCWRFSRTIVPGGVRLERTGRGHRRALFCPPARFPGVEEGYRAAPPSLSIGLRLSVRTRVLAPTVIVLLLLL